MIASIFYPKATTLRYFLVGACDSCLVQCIMLVARFVVDLALAKGESSNRWKKNRASIYCGSTRREYNWE